MIPLSTSELALACAAAEGGLDTDPPDSQFVLCCRGEVHIGFQHTLTWATVVQMLALTGKHPVVKLSSKFKELKPNVTLCVPRPRHCKTHAIIQTQENQMFFFPVLSGEFQLMD